MRAFLEFDDRMFAEETYVVRETDDPRGVFIAGQFVALLRTVDGWAFIHDLAAVEMPKSGEWFPGELLGRPARGKWEP